jgi:biopolymer transport protein ExbB
LALQKKRPKLKRTLVVSLNNKIVLVMENTQEGLNFLELIFKGGAVMIPIGLLSVITIYIIIERVVYIRNASKLEANFLNNLKDLLAKGDLKAARAFCQRINSPISRIIEKGVMRIGKPIKDIESSIESMASIETGVLEKNINNRFLA